MRELDNLIKSANDKEKEMHDSQETTSHDNQATISHNNQEISISINEQQWTDPHCLPSWTIQIRTPDHVYMNEVSSPNHNQYILLVFSFNSTDKDVKVYFETLAPNESNSHRVCLEWKKSYGCSPLVSQYKIPCLSDLGITTLLNDVTVRIQAQMGNMILQHTAQMETFTYKRN